MDVFAARFSLCFVLAVNLATMEVEEPDDGSFALPAAIVQQHQDIATAAEGGMM